MHTPAEIVKLVRTATLSNVHARARRLGLTLQRITRAEREHLLVRRIGRTI